MMRSLASDPAISGPVPFRAAGRSPAGDRQHDPSRADNLRRVRVEAHEAPATLRRHHPGLGPRHRRCLLEVACFTGVTAIALRPAREDGWPVVAGDRVGSVTVWTLKSS